MLIRFASALLILLLSACASNRPVIQDSAEFGPDGQSVAEPLPEGFENEYRNGLSLMEDERFDEALQHWADMSVVFGQYPGVWSNLGLAHYQRGNYEEAVSAYEQVETIDPTFCPVHALSGVAYRELGRFDDAQASYYAAIDCDPDDGRHYYNLGILLDLYRNDLENALEFYRKARRLMPDNEQLNIWVIDLARRVGVDEADPASVDEWYSSLKAPADETTDAVIQGQVTDINASEGVIDAEDSQEVAPADNAVMPEEAGEAPASPETATPDQGTVEEEAL